jgi:hypothetical protein
MIVLHAISTIVLLVILTLKLLSELSIHKHFDANVQPLGILMMSILKTSNVLNVILDVKLALVHKLHSVQVALLKECYKMGCVFVKITLSKIQMVFVCVQLLMPSQYLDSAL